MMPKSVKRFSDDIILLDLALMIDAGYAAWYDSFPIGFA
ncbi:hypothetical protein MPLDJ20_200055 [Mesorhizobium plurifarium]|jgi:hypothetical protein|uniref:Uncharacterized protein n=1 Tax=Mesorhizobium plurifarium TaxID=69974 RepID=A0A090F6Z3_MESPL|nr:hypothetical protein MPLDJ20_200055 [Mesorhizobium plurifarium]CDX60908.1 hypothetical protein MPL1032_300086 [Mesorhizobium plurifarium]CDX63111.1 hypothetical protein MPL3365_80142 [Mesorhizobium plurifarium]